jgi:hypothetical protein
MQKPFILCLLLIAAAPFIWAQDPAADQAQAIKNLLERVTALEKEVQTLKAENQQLQQTSGTAVSAESTSKPTTTAAVPSTAPAAAQEPHNHDHAELPEASENYPNLKIRGFGNVDFGTTDSPIETKGFQIGQFVLHFSSALSRKTSFFGELSWTAHPTGYTTEVERAIIRYDANDFLKVSFGRYHTPVNYWNTAFHHGAWLQTTISRPEMIQFGGRFLPVHFIGALAEGSIPSGPLGLNYNLGVGNGRQSITLFSRNGDAGDVNSNRAWIATVFAKPPALYGLQFGGSIYQDKVTPDATSASQSHYREWISSAHIVWAKENPEFLAEFANVRHRDLFTNQIWNSQGAYAQLAYRLPVLQKKWKPYYRYEFIHVPSTEPVLLVPELSAGHTLGTRYDITDFAALKFEYRHWRRTDAYVFNGFFAQTAFTF